jgi:hypothetical protein
MSVNPPNTGTNIAGTPINRSDYNSISINNSAILTNNRLSNIGADNPAKNFPFPRSLFYDGALLDPGVKEAEKYGLFMFYSFGQGDSNYLDQYYLSERPKYNRRVSSVESKNPTAARLVQDTAAYSSLLTGDRPSSVLNDNPIIGGSSAPYYWKDFIYCKYYGTIPNNRLITLRRFAGPVLDNFSLPKGVTDPEHQKRGIGVPVSQAVTWFGGNTGNSLSDLIGFGVGINWRDEPIDPEKIQKLFGDSLLNSEPLKKLVGLISEFAGSGSGGSTIQEYLADEGKVSALNAIATALSPLGEELTSARFYKAFRDQIKNDPDRFGILSERIWIPVDVIETTQVRDVGLSFTWDELQLKFTYDLTSVGEVNSKIALMDILGNILSLSTNYGNFLTPEVRYDSQFSALTFPGGEEGAQLYYTDLENFLLKFPSIYLAQEGETAATIGGGTLDTDQLETFRRALIKLQAAISGDETAKIDIQGDSTVGTALKGIQSLLGEDAAANWQAPVSLYSGAPIGEWHVVIGNPYNPIATIGNLVCTGCSIDFNETLGPDDFPTTITATISLNHGRPRERGEIESIFNRGDGRLYQSVKSTSANAQTTNTVFDINGNVFNSETGNNFYNPDIGLPGSQGDVYSQNPEV